MAAYASADELRSPMTQPSLSQPLVEARALCSRPPAAHLPPPSAAAPPSALRSLHLTPHTSHLTPPSLTIMHVTPCYTLLYILATPAWHTEVLLAVLAHAHSTESEEVMGLLLGDITVRARGKG